MKRCPLCDFIYEDNQGLCDMDGIELVHDGGALTPASKDSTLKPPASAGSARRRRSLHRLLGFGLGAAVFSAYYWSVNQAAPAGGGQASASYTARPAPPVVEATTELAAPSLPTPPAETPASLTEETTPSPAPAAPPVEPRAAGTGAKKPRPGGGNKKKESKLASILNKTGRMLKKPFGF
jgi:hypothetical protein